MLKYGFRTWESIRVRVRMCLSFDVFQISLVYERPRRATYHSVPFLQVFFVEDVFPRVRF